MYKDIQAQFDENVKEFDIISAECKELLKGNIFKVSWNILTGQIDKC